MKKRLPYALAAYAALMVLATFTLEGPFRLAVWALLAGLAVKAWIATKRE
jgi:hypothetical protein